MKKFVSCILTIAMATSLNIQAFATGNSEDYLQSNINSASDSLDNDSTADILIKEMTKLSRGITIFQNEQEGYILDSIEITEGLKDKYVQGQKIDISKIKANATYKKAQVLRTTPETKTEAITIIEEDIKGFDSSTIGNKNLVIEINQIETKKEINVIEKALSSIKISKGLKKLKYYKGETLDLTGLEVIGTYNDGSSKVETVTLNDISGFDSNKLENQTLTITIGGKRAFLQVEVIAKELPPESNDVKIDRLQYTPPVGFEAELKVTLTKATTNELKLSDFSIHCPGLKDMTIASVSNAIGADKNRVYTLKLASYSDNNYVLEIYLNQGTANKITLEKEFVVRDTNCPIISYPYVTRTDATNAKFKFSSDAPGKIYYLVVKNQLSRARASIPTKEDIQRANKFLDITVAPAEIAIADLVENTAYSLYYITALNADITEVYGPIEISSEPEPSATSKITITEAKVLEDARTQSVKITLSEATSTPLEIKNFEIKCPAGSNLKFDEITNIGKQSYTLIMYGGFRDNNYEAKVTFPDGTFATGTFRCDLATPKISGLSPIRKSETSATITFNSDLEGNIYYGVSKEAYKKPSVAEILATGKKQAIHPNKNTIILDNITMSDKHFYWLAESKSGGRPYFVDGAGKNDFTGRIPDKITGDKPIVPLEVEIDKVEKDGSSLKVTLTKDYADGIINIDQFAPIEIWNDNTSLNSTRNFGINSLSSDNPERKRVFTLSPFGDTRFVAGTYKISITFKDGIATKEFTIN